MTQHVDNADTAVERIHTPGVATPPVSRRWRRPAMIVFAVAAIAYVAYKLPPYLGLDPNEAPIPTDSPAHYAVLVGHVFAGSIALLTAVLQLWPWLRRKHPAVHRFTGRVYLVAGALPAAVLAVSAYPQVPGAGRVAVVVAGTLWSVTAVLGWIAARRKRYAEHRRWMVYSFAIMWGYGVWVFVFANAFYYVVGLDEATSMEAARWGGWISNLVIAHWWMERTAGRTIIGTPRRSRKRRETVESAPDVR
ncbi:DUF2306 domain-containing protein [Lentzea sp. NPDC005914]|uniref:DUF2306 domain-containing protein n=1 Tax=Lentzea sp. NPDC005914 TaxID=3154572 RepID=UPI0033CE565B